MCQNSGTLDPRYSKIAGECLVFFRNMINQSFRPTYPDS